MRLSLGMSVAGVFIEKKNKNKNAFLKRVTSRQREREREGEELKIYNGLV